jgi:hypothetical protein
VTAEPEAPVVWYQLGVLYGEKGLRHRVVQIHAGLRKLSPDLADGLQQLWL